MRMTPVMPPLSTHMSSHEVRLIAGGITIAPLSDGGEPKPKGIFAELSIAIVW